MEFKAQWIIDNKEETGNSRNSIFMTSIQRESTCVQRTT